MNLLGMSGSLRKEATNRKLLQEAQRMFAPQSYIEADLNLPLYDGDLEEAEGLPEAVTRLAGQITEADAVVISTPEYNQSISGVLKNALDWVSRVDGTPWAEKPVAIMSAAAGRAGGARAQYALRLCMQPFRPRIVQGPEVMVAASHKEFDETGRLQGEMYTTLLKDLMDALKAEAGR